MASPSVLLFSSMNRRLYIRLNAGGSWGLGHYFRCTLLADALARSGLPVTFLCNDSPFIRQRQCDGFDSITVDDEQQVLPPALAPTDRESILFDLPIQLSKPAVENAAKLFSAVLLFDQHGPQIEAASMVINSIAHPAWREETGISHCLTGTSLMILDPALLTGSERTSQTPGSALISMGGSDPHDITSRIARVLPAEFPQVQFTCLAGPAFESISRLRDAAANTSNLTILQGAEPAEIASLLASSGIGVFSFGITLHAAAHAGLPALVLSHNRDGALAADTFSAMSGYGLHLGEHSNVSDERLVSAFRDFMENRSLQLKHSKAGRAAVDGRGLLRTAVLIRGVCGL